MNHAPFIWASYVTSVIVLLWAAVAPLVSKKAIIRNIRTFNLAQEQNRDTDS